MKILKKNDSALLIPNDVILQIKDTKKFRLHTEGKEKIKFDKSINKFINECRKLYN